MEFVWAAARVRLTCIQSTLGRTRITNPYAAPCLPFQPRRIQGVFRGYYATPDNQIHERNLEEDLTVKELYA
jgi:hypothetical protein